MSALSFRLLSAKSTDVFEQFGSAKDSYPFATETSESDARIGKYYGPEDFKMVKSNTNYLSDVSPISVDQFSGPSPTLAPGSPLNSRATPSYFVGASSSELSSSYSEPFGNVVLTRQRSFTLPDHNKLDCHISLEPSPQEDGVDYIELEALTQRVDLALQNGMVPMLADGALGGTYFLRDKGKAVCLVCKPGDEEPNAANNPHQATAEEEKAYKGDVVPGSGMYREVAAYLLDRGFSGVPPTRLAKVCHPSFFKVGAQRANDGWKSVEDGHRKLCSAQAYVRHECSAEDMGNAKFSASDVQKLAMLDIRLLNLDRHEGNVLVSRSNPYQRNSPTVTAVTAFAPACAFRENSLAGAASSESLASVVSEASAVSVFSPCFSNPRARLTPGPVTLGDGEDAVLATSAPSALTNSLYEFFGRPDGIAAPAPAAASKKCTYASVTGGPSYIHPPPAPANYRVVPIDHGFTLPCITHLESASLCWLRWSQAQAPILPEVMTAIHELNVDEDISLLKRALGDAIPDRYLLSLHLGSMLLKTGASAGLSLSQIGMLLTNEGNEDSSAEYCYDMPAEVQIAVDRALSASVETLNCVASYDVTDEDTVNNNNMSAAERLSLVLKSANHTRVFLSYLQRQVHALVEATALAANAKKRNTPKANKLKM